MQSPCEDGFGILVFPLFPNFYFRLTAADDLGALLGYLGIYKSFTI